MSFSHAELQRIRDHVAKGALSMIDIANNKPENRGKKPKVGGHQASSMSSVDILCALYLSLKSPGDRIAVKPHAAPVLYSLMHQLGVLPEAKMHELREFKGLQPYPTLLKDPLFVDYTTSSEALGVCAAIYDAYAAVLQNLQLTERVGAAPVPHTYWALCGDGELTEGQIDESLYDAGRWQLDNLVWIVDLNRQSLDRVMDDSGRLEDWVAAKFASHGWQVETLRWGARAETLFARPGGASLRAVLDRLPDPLFHALQIVDGATARGLLTGATGGGARVPLYQRFADFPWSDAEAQGIATCLAEVDDEGLRDALSHLGGHDLEALITALGEARERRDGPVVLIAHTVKGYETSAAGHPENHGALLPTEEVEAWGLERGLSEGPFPVPAELAERLHAFGAALFDAEAHAWVDAELPGELPGISKRAKGSSGEAFQSMNLALMRGEQAPWMQFGAPDVGQTTHLGPVIRQTGVFAPRELPDSWDWLREERQLAFHWRPSAEGQFHSLGIAEGNAFLWAYAFGRRVKLVEDRVPLVPVVTVYDKFFERGFNQLDYAVYSGARFLAVGVPSGTGLSRETATHQSLQTLRMVMDLPGILAYEPAFAADVEAIYQWALGQMWTEHGEAVYLRLTTQPVEQPTALPEGHAGLAVRGAYWLVGEDERDGRHCVVFVASGRKVADARVAAARLLSEHGIGSRILNVTSYEALWRDWDAFASDPTAWDDESRTYFLHELFPDERLNAPLILVGDHLASACEWLPGALQRVRGHRFLGPRTNGEVGDLDSVDRLHGMSVDDLVQAALDEVAWREKVGVR
ncbi:MAG: hypothetical protein EP330_00865 [Deltaproteobacteria bacterium]|nr:MAG: hypothetical protein EP330_00865 [Deltaproteobacteria bacterium]